MLGAAFLSLIGVVLFTQGRSMFQLFLAGRQLEVLDVGLPVLRIVALAMPALATINVLNGALNGAGDTRWPWLFTISGYMLIRIPLTYVLLTPSEQGGWGLGLRGAWLAMFADLYVRAFLVSLRFLHGAWIRTRV
jgi:Na+-driven multidrug efflux pump